MNQPVHKNFFLKHRKKILWIVVILVIFIVSVLFMQLQKERRIWKKTTKYYLKSLANFQKKVWVKVPLLGNISMPINLQNIPFADETGVVLDVKKVIIKDAPAPYNASIIEKDSKYHLFFRHDLLGPSEPEPFFSYIGCVELDSNFKQTDKDFIKINTKSHFSEDPRIVQVGQEYYLVYNDLIGKGNGKRRSIHIANIDLNNFNVNFVTDLDFQLKPVEKNWVPFEYIDEKNRSFLCFEYYMKYPRKILKVPDPKINQLTPFTFSNKVAFQNVNWPNVWGKICGGSTAKKISEDLYLGFFHSSFSENDRVSADIPVWYVMGAYTFEAKPPFRVTAISNYPILFQDIYTSPPLNTAPPLVRCIFPAGFVIENKEGRDLIHLSCGENDCAVKIITMDKEALLKSLKKIDINKPK